MTCPFVAQDSMWQNPIVYIGSVAALTSLTILAYNIFIRSIRKPKASDCNLSAAGAYEVSYFSLDGGRGEKNAWGFHTEDAAAKAGDAALVVTFDITNVSQYELRIKRVAVEVYYYERRRLYLGMGPMIAGKADQFVCTIGSKKKQYTAHLVNGDRDWVTVAAGSTATLHIDVTSREPGAYKVRPVIAWLIKLKMGTLKPQCEDRLVFFYDEADVKEGVQLPNRLI